MKQVGITLMILACCSLGLSAQSLPQAAQSALEQEAAISELTPADIGDYTITDRYTDRWGVEYIYLNQTIGGIRIHNALMTIVLNPQGGAFVTANRFFPKAAERVTAKSPGLSAGQAVGTYRSGELQRRSGLPVQLVSQDGPHRFIYRSSELSDSDIPVELKYTAGKDGLLHLTWDFPIDDPGSADYMSVRIDAITGELVDQTNWTVYCALGPLHAHDHACNKNFGFTISDAEVAAPTSMMPNSYRVFAWPAESPLHGPYVLVTDPADAEYSPYGWHDTNGSPGAEYTITRGNNVHAYLDLDDSGQSQDDEPDGGADLIFDFPFDINSEPDVLRDASIVNLFYAVNMIHDFTYNYGFDEVSGNFQANNYGKGGEQDDYVLAQGQDGSGTNNANFATPADGGNGRMQMFLWDNSGGELFNILSPETLEGGYESSVSTEFGIVPPDMSFEGKLVLVQDDSRENPSFGCENITNGAELSGNIAIIDRGGCEFGYKALAVQNEGAIAAIICNFEDAVIGMAAGASGAQVTIPTLMLKSGDCQRIKLAMQSGDVIGKVERPQQNGPSFFDAGFDNGVIAHEFGHGISNRLTGGPTAAGCLGNDEQMGEGWSDFFTLVTTVQPGDTGENPRGIGNYLTNGTVKGRGIRRFPYSTDMSICPLTFDDIKGTTAPHPLGEVWAATLWDLYWRMVDKHGYDSDIRNASAGNNIAIKLVMDGMKLQPCNPGFLDGRDGILKADSIYNGAANAIDIWEVFARRGLGYFADQGSSNDRNDGVESYESCPLCQDRIRIVKSAANDLMVPTDETTVTVLVSNFRTSISTNVVVTDEIPEGLSYVDGSASHGGQFSNGMLSWSLDTMNVLEEIQLSYKVYADAGIESQKLWYDDVEDELAAYETWSPEIIEGFDVWNFSNEVSNSGDFAWYVQTSGQENDQIIALYEPIEVLGAKPALRFYHWMNTPSNRYAGMVQIQRDGSDTWEHVGDKFIRNGYPGELDYNAFTIPFLNGFYGAGNGFVASYIDLSDYAGELVKIRFRFGTDVDGVMSAVPNGWVVDDIEIMDLVNYDAEACVSYAEGEDNCVALGNGGIIINSGELVNSTDRQIPASGARLYPNPAGDFVNVSLDEAYRNDCTVALYDINGRQVYRSQWDAGSSFMSIPLSGLTSGFYTVKIVSSDRSISLKMIRE